MYTENLEALLALVLPERNLSNARRVSQHSRHQPALARAAGGGSRVSLVTTEGVLLEIGNALAKRYRAEAVATIEGFLESAEVTEDGLTNRLQADHGPRAVLREGDRVRVAAGQPPPTPARPLPCGSQPQAGGVDPFLMLADRTDTDTKIWT